jgi:deoxycytidine triphosphate deaminase
MTIVPSDDFSRLIGTKHLTIDPFFPTYSSPESHYIHLSPVLWRYKSMSKIQNGKPLTAFTEPTKLKKENMTKLDLKQRGYRYRMSPGEIVLGTSFEYLGVSNSYRMNIESTTSNDRNLIWVRSGRVHPGHGMTRSFRATLAIQNPSDCMITELSATHIDDAGIIHYGQEIAQITLEELSKPARVGYDDWSEGVYSGDTEAKPSKIHDMFVKGREEGFALPPKSKHRK